VLHAALERQLRKLGASAGAAPSAEQWQGFLERVNQMYVQGDQDRYTLERSIAISSSEMKELNARLATQRDRLYVTVTSMGDGLCVLDAEGIVEIANPAAERLLGAEPGALKGQQLGDLVAGFWPLERERRKPLLEFRKAIGSGGSCRFDDARFMTLAGKWLPVSFVLTPIEGSQSVQGTVLIFSDIRQRKLAEDALRESESRFRAIFESAAVGIVRLRVDGSIADCNLALCDMLGDTREGLANQSLFECVHPDERASARERFEGLRRDAKADRQVERRYVQRDGSTVWGIETVSFVRNPEGQPVFAIGVVENVTARKHLEVSLRHALKLEAVGRLASGIAHEINTPVQFVGDSVHFVRESMRDIIDVLARYHALRDAAASLLPEVVAEVSAAEEKADVEYLVEQVPKALDRASDGLDRVATIVRGMKEFAHPDQTKKSPTQLNHALETTLTIARNEYKYVAEVETDFGDLPLVTCHAGELNQVFLNVIVNAAHAIGDVVRGTDAKGRIRVKTWRENGSAFVAISDTGAGIPESVRDQVFDPFFTTKEVGRGTGQGLAIARSVVVDKHQGELTFETASGVGTTFVVRLPIEPQAGGQPT
jgi:PAS domain S-box-containing protein